MSKKIYFRDNADLCTTISNHLDYMAENGIKEMDVYLAKREVGSDWFFCHYYGEVGVKSEGGCGKMCEKYNPRNGKSGCCTYNGYVYDQTDIKKTLKI